MARRKLNDLIIENARIIYPNFSGKESTYNREGKRNFCVVIDDKEMAHRLSADGWNMRCKPALNDGDEEMCYLQVAVNFENIPPKVVMISGKQKTVLDENSIAALDYADIKNVDLTINPYCWEVQGKQGVKAYLKNMYVTIERDPFAEKYSDLDDAEGLPFD